MPPSQRTTLSPSPSHPRRGLHEEPEIPFSKSTAPRQSALTNAKLIDVFAGMLHLTPAEKRCLIGQICVSDSYDEHGNCGLWLPKDDYVSGGRLGRDHKHTLSDVPSHFIRDQLMELIDENLIKQTAELNEDQRNTVQRALFPDLTADELSEYSRALARKREDGQCAYRTKYGWHT